MNMPDRFKQLAPFIPPHSWEQDRNVTRGAALRAASRVHSKRCLQILTLLATKPLCIFETAALLGTPISRSASSSPYSPIAPPLILPHQISGRFRELTDAGAIMKTGIRRPTPTGCTAEVYQITLAGIAILEESSRHAPRAVAPPPGGSVEPSSNSPSAVRLEDGFGADDLVPWNPPSTPLQTEGER
jgi:hypothetical protein